MRIIIDIDGNNINVITEPQQPAGIASAVVPAVRPTPPEILKAAAAIGAHDAGPAPAHVRELQSISGPAKAGAAPSPTGTAAKTPLSKRSAKSKKR